MKTDLITEIKQLTAGKWDDLILRFIGSEALIRKEGPCPMCGGKTRFRYDNRHGNGDYFCSGCGAGDGMDLLMKYHNWDYKKLKDEIAPVADYCKTKAATKPKKNYQKDKERLVRIGNALQPTGGPMVKYLMDRGLLDAPSSLKYHKALPYYEMDKNGKPKLIGAFPAMVARVEDVNGYTCTFHATFLTQEGKKLGVEAPKKTFPHVRSLDGSAIRLHPCINGRLILAEGIETALAASEYYGVAAWATRNSGAMKKIQLPDNVTDVMIVADHDASYTGQAAAFELAHRLKVREKRNVDVVVPGHMGEDFLDWYVRNNQGVA